MRPTHSFLSRTQSVNTSKTWNRWTIPPQEWSSVLYFQLLGYAIPWDHLLGKETDISLNLSQIFCFISEVIGFLSSKPDPYISRYTAKDRNGRVYYYEENGNESCWSLPNVGLSIQVRELFRHVIRTWVRLSLAIENVPNTFNSHKIHSGSLNCSQSSSRQGTAGMTLYQNALAPHTIYIYATRNNDMMFW